MFSHNLCSCLLSLLWCGLKERQFHANPAPNLLNQFVPKKTDKPNITVQQSFQLKTDSRGEEYARKWMAQVNLFIYNKKQV